MTQVSKISNGWITASWLLSAAACVAALFLFFPAGPQADKTGFCLPAPGEWFATSRYLSWGLNTAILYICCASCYALNKRYYFVKSTDGVFSSLFLLLTACNPYVAHSFTSAALLTPVAILTLHLLFSNYRERQSAQGLFVIATFCAVGAMAEHAFILVAAAALVGAIIMRCINFKSLMAFLMGLAAPFWVALGFGLIKPEDFHMPYLTSAFAPKETLSAFIMMTGCGILFIIALLLALNNVVKLYAGNAKIRSENNVINIFGVFASLGMMIDYNNMTAYVGIFNMWVALQVANLFAMWHIRKAWILYLIIMAGALAICGATILNS